MTRSRFNSQHPNPSTFQKVKDWIYETFQKVKNWIYEKCKSKPVRYFVSAIAGGGAALVVIAGLAYIEVTGPVAIIGAIIAGIIVAVRENKKLLDSQKVDVLSEDNARLLAQHQEQMETLDNQQKEIEHLSQQNVELQETTSRILAIINSDTSNTDSKEQKTKLHDPNKSPQKIENSIDDIEIKLGTVDPKAPGWDNYRTQDESSSLTKLPPETNESKTTSQSTKSKLSEYLSKHAKNDDDSLIESFANMNEELRKKTTAHSNKTEEHEDDELSELVTPRSHFG